jgi:DDE superfamily endonuclease
VEVWFEDEARFGQKGTLTTVWARRGSRPTAVRQTEYDYLWVIAAACPASGAATGIIMPHLDTDVINLFLSEFSQQLAPDVHAVLIWDQAGFHTSDSLSVPSNVSLISLPPYSPELNPIENLWHYLRSHYWSNRVYEDWEILKQAAVQGMVTVGNDPERIKSVCAAPYLRPLQTEAP